MRLVCLLAAALAFAGCDEKLSSIAGPTPNLEPTFASIQAEVFEKTDSAGRAACANCHTSVGRTPSGGLDLSHDLAYANLVTSLTAHNPRLRIESASHGSTAPAAPYPRAGELTAGAWNAVAAINNRVSVQLLAD